MANIITAPESGIYFDGNTAGVADIPTLTGNASGVAIQYDGYAGIEINSSATGANYLDRFSVEGANGRLFGVSDAVTGTVFSVNDAAGLPIIEVESTSDYDKITIGEYGTDALVISGSSVEIGGETAATRDWVTGQGYVTASSEQQTLDNVLGRGNTSSNSMSVGAITGSALTIDTDTLYVDAENNKVGIGTTSPSKKLDVAGTLGTDSHATIGYLSTRQIHLRTNDGTQIINGFGIRQDNSGGTNGYRSYLDAMKSLTINAGYSGSSNSYFSVNVQGSNKLYIKNSGNVGIGTTSPSRTLHVNAGTLNFVALFQSTDDKASILIQDNDTLNYIHSQDGYLSLGGQSSLHASNLNIRTSDGNVGIGTTSPSAKLDVEGPIAQKVYTASTLPSASPAGQRAFISDSAYGLATAIGSIVSGGGGNTIPVYSDGSSWRAG